MPLGFFNHPVLLAAVAVVAIGVVIYELVTTEKCHGPNRRPPPPPDDFPGPRQPPGGRPGSRPPPGGRPGSRPPPGDRPGSLPPPGGRPGSRPPPGGLPGPRRALDDPRKPSNPSDNPGKSPEKPPIVSPKKNVSSKGSEISDESRVLPHPNSTMNNLRRRTFDRTSNKENSLENSQNVSKDVSATTVKKASEISSTSSSQQNSPNKKFDENNYSKNMLDKLTNDTKNINENIKCESFLRRNICEEESDCSESNLISESEEKLINRNVKNLYPEVDFHPSSNLRSDIDKSSSWPVSDEDTYKNQLYEGLKNDVYDSKENLDNSVIGSPERIQEKKPSDRKICQGCEEKPVNTRAYPCNHSYLCVDCAVRIFRCYKKCSICLAHVEEFLQFAS